MKTALLCTLGFVLLANAAVAVPIATGKVTLSPKLEGAAKGIRTLFLSVYDASKKGAPAMPYGATKVELSKDVSGEVTAFDLDTKTMMMMTSMEKLPAKVDIKAKLDKDGSAGPDAAGDLIGWARSVKPGTGKVVIKIDKAVR